MKKKTVLTGLLLILVMAVMVGFAGCGGGEEAVEEELTLETYLADNPDKMEQMEQMASDGGMELEVVENNLAFYYIYPEVLTEDTMQAVEAEADRLMEETLYDKFSEAVANMREGTGIEAATLTITFQDPEGTVICSYEF